MPGNTLRKSIFFIGVATTMVFIIEVITPRGVSESTLYVLVILVSLWSANRRVVFGTIILCTLLTIIGFFLSPDSIVLWKSVLNRFFSILAFVIVGLIGLMRLRTEENLGESQQRYRNALDHLMEGAQIIGYDWRYLYSNEVAAVQGQQTRENLLGRTMMEVYPGIEQSGFFQILQRSMQDRLPQLMENEFVHADGTTSWLELSIQPVKEGLFILSNDITMRKRAEAELGQINIELEKRVAERTHSLNITNEQLQDELGRRRQAEKIILQQNNMFSKLHTITLDLLREHDIDKLLGKIVELSAAFLDADYAEILLKDGDVLIVRAATNNHSHLIGERVGANEARLSWRAVETKKPVVLSDYSKWPHRRDVYNILSLHAVAEFPILDGQQCLGVLGFGREKPDYGFDDDHIRFGELFSNLTALVLNNAQLRTMLHEQSIIDPLTGLYNRRYMEATLLQQLSRVARQLHPLAIIMIDIDHFKLFNDTHGHPIGDELLRAFGQLLKGSIRVEDIACRYGGEEFILIMPNTSLEMAKQRADHIQEQAKILKIHHAGRSYDGATLSMGIAVYPQHGKSKDEVIQNADAALYQAKRNGRDQIVIAVKNLDRSGLEGDR
ncbi:MAG: diguanylate cyclase [Anaerolineales bacterium]|nr:diguanylate cyclase [Anaerolineales bacterium]